MRTFSFSFIVLRSAFCVLRSMKVIPKSGPITATITAPPSKSYSVRALLLAAMSEGTTTITNCLDADDTRYAFEALKSIGYDARGRFSAS
jgi:5-enolpyruvylshikimate-3-phosphate synthase